MTRVTRRTILLPVLRRTLRALVSEPTARREVASALWLVAKQTAARDTIRPVEPLALRGVDLVRSRGFVGDPNWMVVAALCSVLECRTFFEFGTYLGKMAWSVAATNPDAEVYTLDLPGESALRETAFEVTDPHLFRAWDRGLFFAGTDEESRIHQLTGDSATFDFAPYRGRIDVVYVDGSHSYDYVKSDSENAFGMLTPTGTILWDDYQYPEVYKYLDELSASLDGHLLQIRGTRLVAFSRRELV